MPIHIGGHADRRMSELSRDVFQGLAIAQEQAGERVALIPMSELAA